MNSIWDEKGLCKTCKGLGYTTLKNGTRVCHACRGKKRANNSEASKSEPVIQRENLCPKCGGLGYISGCCGGTGTNCPLCNL